MNRNVLIGLITLLVLAVVGGGVFLLKGLTKPPVANQVEEEQEKTVKELTLAERPYVSLTPGASCEYTISLSGIQNDPEDIEYEITYQDASGVTQGVSGDIKPKGSSQGSKTILFGTESSGNRRCDKGVEAGDITLRYRNADGKLLAKLETPFAIAEDKASISVGKFTVDFGKLTKGKYVAMGTLGLPGPYPDDPAEGPFGIFTSSKTAVTATVKITGAGKVYGWNGSTWADSASFKLPATSSFILAE
jgi:hypothetical protein